MRHDYLKKKNFTAKVVGEKEVVCPITGKNVVCKILEPGPQDIKVPCKQPWRSKNINRRNRANGSR